MDEVLRDELHVGDHVAVNGDDWTLVGHEFVLVELEPVAGSTQCVVGEDADRRYVSRSDLRRVA